MPRLAALLSPLLTVITCDRRGRGESGDSRTYAIEREIEDIDSLMSTVGRPVSLFGTSSGACLALRAAAALGDKVERLALHEPPYNSNPAEAEGWADYGRRLGPFLAAGRNADAVELFMTLIGTPPETVAQVRESPLWPKLEALAPTLAYDRAAVGEDRSIPFGLAAKVRRPVLVMSGTLTAPFIVETARTLAGVFPDARYKVLEGQAHNFAAEAVAPELIEFLA
jgi:pimeloyl-ACP methyl ester carboxylesterase